MNDLLTFFSYYLETEGLSKSSRKNYLSDARRFFTYLEEHGKPNSLSQLTTKDVKAYLKYVNKLDIAEGSRRRYTASFNRFIDWADTYGHTQQVNPRLSAIPPHVKEKTSLPSQSFQAAPNKSVKEGKTTYQTPGGKRQRRGLKYATTAGAAFALLFTSFSATYPLLNNGAGVTTLFTKDKVEEESYVKTGTEGRVLPERTTKGILEFNTDTKVDGLLEVSGGINTYGADIDAESGNIFGQNLVYSVQGGDNVSVTPGQNPVINLSLPELVTTLQGQTGAVELAEGDDIQIDGLEISNISTLESVVSRGDCADCLVDEYIIDALTISADGNIDAGAITTGLLGVNVGGTGLSTIAAGDLLYGSAADTLAPLAVGTEGQVLKVTSGVPTWGAESANPSLTSGSVVFHTGAVFAEDNANFYWDDSSNYFGLGTNSPSATLDVAGTAEITGALTLSGGSVILDNATDIDIDDNTASGLTLSQGSNNYIDIDTVNSLEKIDFGNTSVNPDYNFLGTGQVTVSGDLAVNGDGGSDANITSDGPLNINAVGPLTLGSTSQTADLQGTDVTITSNTGSDISFVAADDIIFNDAQLLSQITLTDTATGITGGYTGIIDALNAALSGGASSQWTLNGTAIYPTNGSAVGIGTTAPGAALDIGGGSGQLADGADDLLVAGDLEIDDDLRLDGGAITTSVATTWDLLNSDANALNIESGLFVLDTENNRVGIGTTAPSYALDVAGTAGISGALSLTGLSSGTDNTVLVLDSSNNVATDEIDSRVWGSTLLDGTGTSNYLSYWTDTNTLTSSSLYETGGLIGLGTTAPGAALDIGGGSGQLADGADDLLVAGDLEIDDDLRLDGGAITTSVATTWDLLNSDSNALNIENGLFVLDTNNTRIGVGTTAPGQTLSIAGTLGIMETGASPQYYTAFQGGDQSGNVTYTLPTGHAASNDYVLTAQTDGTLAWQEVTGISGAGDITAVGSETSGAAFAGSSADDEWLGLGASAGRIQFDDQSIDEINFLDTYVGIGTSAPQAALHVIGNVKDPLLASEVYDGDGEFTSLAQAGSVHVQGNYAYVASSAGDDALTVIDISDPTDPDLISSVSDGDGEFSRLNGENKVFVSGNYAYVTSYVDDALTIIDISDPNNPDLMSEVYDNDGEFSRLNVANGIYVSGNYAYVTARTDAALTIMDISDPTDPVLMSEIYDGDGEFSRLSQASEVFVSGNYAYITSWTDSALTIADISDPTDPLLVSEVYSGDGEFSYLSGANDVFVSGKYAYITSDLSDSLTIIDISNPADPDLVSEVYDGDGEFSRLNGAHKIAVSGDYVYIAANTDDAITIIDVSDPTNPELVKEIYDGDGTYSRLEGAYGIYASGNYVYITSNVDHSLTIMDVSGQIVNSLFAGAIKTGGLQVMDNAYFDNDVAINGGLTAIDAFFTGDVGIYNSGGQNALSVKQDGTGNLLSLFDGSSEVFTVEDGGNVGIGTSNPTAALDVSGSINFDTTTLTLNDANLSSAITLTDSDSSFTSGDTAIVDAINAAYSAGSGAGGGVWTAYGTDIAPTTATQVGLGTTSPTARLELAVGSSDAMTALLIDANDADQIAAQINASQDTADVIDLVADSLTTGYGIDISVDALTTGQAINVASTSTSLTTGGLASFDWSPSSSTTATGDLLSLNVGSNGVLGNIFNVQDNGSSVFSVSQSQIVNALPTSFTSPGDVSIAYDLNFTNPTLSSIQSNAPLSIEAGKSYESSNLTLKTYNSGNLVLDTPGGVTLNQAQNWDLAEDTNALAIENGLLTFDSSNDYIGIGTTNPTGKLTVGSGQILIPNGSTSAPGIAFTNDTDAGLYYNSGAGGAAFYQDGESIQLRNNRIDINVAGGQSIEFQTTYMRLFDYVHAGSAITGAARFNAYANSSSEVAAAIFGDSGQTANIFEVNSDGSSGGDHFVVAGSGNVGIGATNPVGNLHVMLDDNDASPLLFEDINGDDYLKFITTNSSESLDFGNTTINPDYNFLGSGTTTLSGNLNFSGSSLEINATNGLTINPSGTLTLGNTAQTSALQGAAVTITSNSGNDVTVTAADDILFSDAQVTNLTLSDVDSTLPNSNTGIVDAINDAYNAATGSGGGIWSVNGTDLFPTSATQIGIGTSAPTARLELAVGASDGMTAFLLDSNDADQIAAQINASQDTADVIDLVADSLTTGYGIDISVDALTTGQAINVASTSTALTTGGLASFDWSPGSSTTATGDLLSLNVGSNGVLGNIFNVQDNGSSVFSVSQSQIVNALPTSFTSPGDVSIAYDLNFTNQTLSTIQSNAPLSIEAGESHESNNLILKTYNSGNLVLNLPGGAVLNQAQEWDLANDTSALNFESGLLNLDTTNTQVGIGTTAPSATLDVVGSVQLDATTITLDDTNLSSAITLTSSDTSFTSGDTAIVDAINAAYTAASGGAGGVWSTNGTDLFPTSATQIGIGTSAPTARLELGVGSSDAMTALLIDANDADQIAAQINASQDTADVIDLVADSLTTGYGIDISVDALTTGQAINVESTSTALTTGGLASFDWSPGSSTTATGDLLSLNVGSNGVLGNIFNVQDNGSSVFSVSQSQIVNALPTSFTSPGDVSIAYDLNFTNPTASYVSFNSGPGYIRTDHPSANNDLTLSAANSGIVIIDDKAHIQEDLIVGADTSSTSTLGARTVLTDFSLGGDDLFVAGTAGFEGNVYLDAALSLADDQSITFGLDSDFTIKYDTTSTDLELAPNAGGDVSFFADAESGENQTLEVYGYLTAGTGPEALAISVDDTNDEGLIDISAGSDITGVAIKLSDAAGSDEFRIRDSAGNAVFTIDSDGNVALVDGGLLDLSAIAQDDTALQGLRLPQGTANPSNPTSGEGNLYWDTDDDALKAYDGSAWVDVAGSSTGTIVLEAEYAGATLSADGSNNTGSMTTDNTRSSSTNWMNYYDWTSSQVSLQDYDVIARFTLPPDFSSWATSDAIVVDYVTETTSTSDNQIDISVYLESSGTSDVDDNDNVSSSAGTWATTSMDDSDLGDCNAAGEVCVMVINMQSKDSYYSRIGDITLNYTK